MGEFLAYPFLRQTNTRRYEMAMRDPLSMYLFIEELTVIFLRKKNYIYRLTQTSGSNSEVFAGGFS